MVRWEYGPVPLGPEEIDGLLAPPGKASTLLTDHLIIGLPLWSEPAQEKWFRSNHPYNYKSLIVCWLIVFEVMTF